jgi:hypothetical protein
MNKSGNSIVISIRVDKKVKRIIEQENLEPAREAKTALEELAKRVEFKKAMRGLTDFVKRNVKPSKRGFASSTIRRDRDEMH